MGLAKPYFDRREFDKMSRDELTDAHISALTQLEESKSETTLWRELAESREEPWI